MTWLLRGKTVLLNFQTARSAIQTTFKTTTAEVYSISTEVCANMYVSNLSYTTINLYSKSCLRPCHGTLSYYIYFVIVVLTELFDLFANGSLIWRLAVWIQLTGRVCALNVAPASLLVIDNANVERIVAESRIRCVRTTPPAFYGRCCDWKRKYK